MPPASAHQCNTCFQYEMHLSKSDKSGKMCQSEGLAVSVDCQTGALGSMLPATCTGCQPAGLHGTGSRLLASAECCSRGLKWPPMDSSVAWMVEPHGLADSTLACHLSMGVGRCSAIASADNGVSIPHKHRPCNRPALGYPLLCNPGHWGTAPWLSRLAWWRSHRASLHHCWPSTVKP